MSEYIFSLYKYKENLGILLFVFFCINYLVNSVSIGGRGHALSDLVDALHQSSIELAKPHEEELYKVVYSTCDLFL